MSMILESTKPKSFFFVLMPFDEKFTDIYELGIKASCIECGAYCERVDEQVFEGTILNRIYNQISKADYLIADMSDRNPNVFYEVGYAHALGKPTILLTQNSEDIPFDLKQYPHIIYNNQIVKLKQELNNKIKWFIENNVNPKTDYKVGIELFLNEFNLSDNNVCYNQPEDQIFNPKITIKNSSTTTYLPGDFQIGIITSAKYPHLPKSEINTTKLPDGNYLHMLPFFDTLFPGAYTSYHIMFARQTENEFMLKFRVFTNAGSRDYNLKMKK